VRTAAVRMLSINGLKCVLRPKRGGPPKKIRELFNLNGGEYFLMKAKPEKGTIKLKLVEFADEEPEKELETK
jgi:hypothetical protein